MYESSCFHNSNCSWVYRPGLKMKKVEILPNSIWGQVVMSSLNLTSFFGKYGSSSKEKPTMDSLPMSFCRHLKVTKVVRLLHRSSSSSTFCPQMGVTVGVTRTFNEVTVCAGTMYSCNTIPVNYFTCLSALPYADLTLV